tara:strand:- start:1425 stop:3200 length:1776 start_codon:yes stop_codon:yes gene_type:complete
MSLKEEQQKVRLSDTKAFRFLLSYLKEDKKLFSFGMVLLVLASASGIFAAYLISKVIDKGVLNNDYVTGLYYASYLLFFEALAVGLIYFSRRILAKVGVRTIYRIRKAMFRHLNQLPMSYYDKTPQGRIATRLTHDVDDLEQFFSVSLGRLGVEFLKATFVWFAILLTDIRIGIFISISTLPIILITYFSKTKIRNLHWAMSNQSSRINSQLSENIQGLNIIRSFGLEDFSKQKYDDKVLGYLGAAKAFNRFNTFLRPIMSFLSQIPLLVLIVLGGYYITRDWLSIGILITYFRYVEQFTSPIEFISREIHVLQQAFTSADRVTQFLQERKEKEILPSSGTQHAKLLGDIKLADLSMYYEKDQWILNDINLHIKSGQNIGFLGRTGSGKTTTIGLLSRLYPYQKGQILLDDQPIEDWPLNDLRQQIGFVSQDAYLFKGTIRENLVLHRDFTEAQIALAVKTSGLQKLLEAKGRNLESEVLDRGENFSSGEKQILAITRVLLHDPKIIIFDEATSHVDPRLENLIQNTLKEISKNRTMIIIAHRIHTLDICEKLFVFRDGKIVAEGSKAELLESSAYFQELYRFSLTKEYND